MYDFEDECGWDEFEARECFGEEREEMEDMNGFDFGDQDTDLYGEW